MTKKQSLIDEKIVVIIIRKSLILAYVHNMMLAREFLA